PRIFLSRCLLPEQLGDPVPQIWSISSPFCLLRVPREAVRRRDRGTREQSTSHAAARSRAKAQWSRRPPPLEGARIGSDGARLDEPEPAQLRQPVGECRSLDASTQPLAHLAGRQPFRGDGVESFLGGWVQRYATVPM